MVDQFMNITLKYFFYFRYDVSFIHEHVIYLTGVNFLEMLYPWTRDLIDRCKRLEIQFSRGEGSDPNNLFNSSTY